MDKMIIDQKFIDNEIDVTINVITSVKGQGKKDNNGIKILDKDGKPVPSFEPVPCELKVHVKTTLAKAMARLGAQVAVDFANKYRPQGIEAVRNKKNWLIEWDEFYSKTPARTNIAKLEKITTTSSESELKEMQAKIEDMIKQRKMQQAPATKVA